MYFNHFFIKIFKANIRFNVYEPPPDGSRDYIKIKKVARRLNTILSFSYQYEDSLSALFVLICDSGTTVESSVLILLVTEQSKTIFDFNVSAAKYLLLRPVSDEIFYRPQAVS